jgi:hypothetical protein
MMLVTYFNREALDYLVAFQVPINFLFNGEVLATRVDEKTRARLLDPRGMTRPFLIKDIDAWAEHHASALDVRAKAIRKEADDIRRKRFAREHNVTFPLDRENETLFQLSPYNVGGVS